MAKEAAHKLKKKFRASLLLLLAAVISITTATYAWFSLSNTTVVQDMTVQVATSTALKARTAPSANLNDYASTITNEMVEGALGFKLEELRLWPLTSGNGYNLYTQSTNSVSGASAVDPKSKNYLELKLWFMADTDMNVYLNADNSPGLTGADADGTMVFSAGTNTSSQEPVEKCARISFTPMALRSGGSVTNASDYTVVETPSIYEPNKDGGTTLNGNARSQNIGSGDLQQTFVSLGNNAGTNKGTSSETPFIFKLSRNTPKLVVIRLWIEGEDSECRNGNNGSAINIEEAKLVARLRFCGADDNGLFLEAGSGV